MARRKTKKRPTPDSIPRAPLVHALQDRIRQYGLSLNVAAQIVDDAPSQMSRLMCGYVGDFSADRLVKMLMRLGSDVEIVVRHGDRLGKRGRSRVVVRKKARSA